MEKDDCSTLKMCIKHTDTWCSNYANILAVGQILHSERVLDNVDIVFDYFRYPWHYEPEMKDLIKEYELDAVSEDFFNIPIAGRELALEWMFALGIVNNDVYELLFDDMEDRL